MTWASQRFSDWRHQFSAPWHAMRLGTTGDRYGVFLYVISLPHICFAVLVVVATVATERNGLWGTLQCSLEQRPLKNQYSTNILVFPTRQVPHQKQLPTKSRWRCIRRRSWTIFASWSHRRPAPHCCFACKNHDGCFIRQSTIWRLSKAPKSFADRLHQKF